MHWLLMIVRFLLQAFSGDRGNGVALAARIDGRVEQRCRRSQEESVWSPLLAFLRGDEGASTRWGRRDRNSTRSSGGHRPTPRQSQRP
jgi:hypothetical protein